MPDTQSCQHILELIKNKKQNPDFKIVKASEAVKVEVGNKLSGN